MAVIELMKKLVEETRENNQLLKQLVMGDKRESPTKSNSHSENLRSPQKKFLSPSKYSEETEKEEEAEEKMIKRISLESLAKRSI